MLNSKFINFSLNFESNRLVGSKNSKNFLLEKSQEFLFKNVSLTLPRLVSNLNHKVTFLILTDGSLFVLDYTLPHKGLNKQYKSEVYHYAISRNDYLSVFF